MIILVESGYSHHAHLLRPTETSSYHAQSTAQTPVLEKSDPWVQKIQETLQRAFLSYDMQAKIIDTRLTPNALLIRLQGSDRLKIEDIEKKKSVLLTTHGLKLLNIIA